MKFRRDGYCAAVTVVCRESKKETVLIDISSLNMRCASGLTGRLWMLQGCRAQIVLWRPVHQQAFASASMVGLGRREREGGGGGGGGCRCCKGQSRDRNLSGTCANEVWLISWHALLPEFEGYQRRRVDAARDSITLVLVNKVAHQRVQASPAEYGLMLQA